PVLLVDGSPGDGGHTSYGSLFYLEKLCASAQIFAPKIITELELPTATLQNFDVVVLSDTSDPGPAMRESLHNFVAGGGLLIIYPGGRTDTQRLNQSLGDDGAKLLPATLGQQVKLSSADQIAEGKAFDAENFQRNPVMQVFSGDYKAGKEVGLLT